MKYTAALISFFSVLLFVNCGKKDLPAPNVLNASNTGIYQQANTSPVLTAPCAANLSPNRISYTFSPSGNVMYFTPQADEFMGELEVTCSDYSTYNKIKITLPYAGTYVGTIKYAVQGNVQLDHSYSSAFYYAYYTGYQGDIYAEYSSTNITLSFCDVKVKDSYGSIHNVTGRVVIANNF